METQLKDHSKGQASRVSPRQLFLLTMAGSAAFWIVDFIIAVSPFSAEYQAAFSISSLPVALVEAFIGGGVVAFLVNLFLFHFFDRFPGNYAIPKALILSIAMMVIIEVLSTLLNPQKASVYLLVDTGMNLPRFLALGMVVGYLFDRLKRKALR